jgi:hypothetical protein
MNWALSWGITDQDGKIVFTQVRKSEPDTVQVAAIHQTAYFAKKLEASRGLIRPTAIQGYQQEAGHGG